MTPNLFFLFFQLLLPLVFSQTPTDVFLDCGADAETTFRGIRWLADTDYVNSGTSRNIQVEGLLPILSTVRSFPLQNNPLRKFCYEIPVLRGRKYLVRTTYYYGDVNGNANPPVFDQIVDSTLWSKVNTTADYLNRSASYYEGVFMPNGKNLSVCLAANTYTDSDPFISALEVVRLWDQLYNYTDFRENALSLVARHAFGSGGEMIQYPDDQFYRYWQPYGDYSSSQSTSAELSVSGIWNLPPSQVFRTRLTTGPTAPLTLLWPPALLPQSNYSIALYFADAETSSGSSRIMDISLNGVPYYKNLSVNPAGLVVFANWWPLSESTNLTLTSVPGSTAGPLINAGEVFRLVHVGGRTLPRDVIAMINLRNSFENPPTDWYGEPCLPSQYSWTGVTCAGEARIRVVTLNLSSLGLSGSISPSIARLTALRSIILRNNSLVGTIPDVGTLRGLEVLHLEDNQLTGGIPPSLVNLTRLRELFLQNNNLTGDIPRNLTTKPGLTLRYTPGNPLLSAQPQS